MKRIYLAILLPVAAILFFACSKNEAAGTENEIPAHIKERVTALNLSVQGMYKTDGGYIAEQDIFLSNDLLNSTVQTTHYLGPNQEHYRTASLVTGLPRVIGVRYSGTTASISNAINTAIARYNALNLQLRFQRVTAGGNILVSNVSGVSYNALAGFPSGGNPYNSIRVNTAVAAWPANTIATLIAHEIGHCIGFAHTDLLDDFSCGGIAPAPQPISFIHIPGTPTLGSGDPNSWMVRCISPGINRPFTAFDQLALNYLY